MQLTIKLAVIDLAWKNERNTTATAFGYLDEGCLRLIKIHAVLKGFDQLKSIIESDCTISHSVAFTTK